MTRLTYSTARLLAQLLRVVGRRSSIAEGTRVLMFHDIIESRDQSDLYSLPYERFESGLTELSNIKDVSGQLFVPFSDTPHPGIAITFDDGYHSTYQLAAQFFLKHRIPFHLFITKSFVLGENPKFLRTYELEELAKMPGVSFGLHGETHQPMTSLTSVELRRSLHDARNWLEQIIQLPVTSLSYPHGMTSKSVENVVQEMGFSCAACSKPGTFSSSEQRYVIPRIDIWAMDSPRVFVDKARGVWDPILP